MPLRFVPYRSNGCVTTGQVMPAAPGTRARFDVWEPTPDPDIRKCSEVDIPIVAWLVEGDGSYLTPMVPCDTGHVITVHQWMSEQQSEERRAVWTFNFVGGEWIKLSHKEEFNGK